MKSLVCGWPGLRALPPIVAFVSLLLVLTAAPTSAQLGPDDFRFDMVSNGAGPVQGVHGYDVTEAPTEYGAYSADWYRDVLESDSSSILGLQGGMQQAGGWYFIVRADEGKVLQFNDTNWDGGQYIGGNLIDIRFTQAGGKGFGGWEDPIIDVPYEAWWLGRSASDTSDDFRLIPEGPFYFEIGEGEEHPVSGQVFLWSPSDQTPGDAGYRKFVAEASVANPDEYHVHDVGGASDLLDGIHLLNWGRHQYESTPGAGDGPVGAWPEWGTTFRIRAADVVEPDCGLSAFDASVPITMTMDVLDTGGLASIRVIDHGGMTLDYPSFTPGYAAPVTVTAVQQQLFGPSDPVLEIEDISGNRTTCQALGDDKHDVQAAIHNAGNIVLALRSASLLGADCDWDYDYNGYWPKQDGANNICGGSLWLAADDAVTYSFWNIREDPYGEPNQYRWLPVPGMNAGPGVRAHQEIRFQYRSEDDAIEVEQTSYQWSEPDRDDFIIFAYTIENLTSIPVTETVPGLWLDPDVDLEFHYSNYVGYDVANEIVYALSEDSTTYVGLRVLGAPTLTAVAYGSGHFSNAGRAEGLLRAGFPEMPTDLQDYRILVSTGPFPLAVGEKRTVSFGLVMGESLEALTANATAMQQQYESIGVNTEGIPGQLPVAVGLYTNYPNPFNPTTTIAYDLPRTLEATLTVYDVLGRQVSVLASGTKPAGTYDVSFDATDLPSGVYFYRLQAGDYVGTKRMVVVK